MAGHRVMAGRWAGSLRGAGRLGAALMVAASVLALPPAARAATVEVPCEGEGGGPGGLVAAVALANDTPGQDTILLAPGCTYTFTAAYGAGSALPEVTSEIIIQAAARPSRAARLQVSASSGRPPAEISRSPT